MRRLAAIAMCAAATVAVVAAPAPASAAPKTIALVGLEIGGDGAPELRPQLALSILAGLAEAKAKTVELDDVLDALRDTPELIGCMSSTCLARIGEKLKVDGFVRGKVQAEGADYTVELELYNRSELIHRVQRPCSVCTINELNMLTKSTARQLLESASDSPVQVIIRTEPSGAELSIDGLGQGAAPFEGPLSPGPHFVTAKLPDGETVRQRIEVSEASGAEPIIIKFPRDIATPPPIITRDSSLGTWKWVAAGGAVGGVALGVTLLILDGRPTCDANDMVCPEVNDTRVGGWISLGVGAALGGAAGYLFWRDRENRRRVSATAAPTPGGAAASLRVDF